MDKTQKTKNAVIADHGDYLEIDISTPKHPETIMLIDKPDWEYLQSIGIGRVFAFSKEKDRTNYARVKVSGKIHQAHRLLLPDSECVDHINHNGVDNRRENIRACTKSQNQWNRRTNDTNNTSGFKGVHWDASCGKWMANIKKNGIRKYLGVFDSIEDAHKVYCDAARDLHGEFVCTGGK